MSYENLVQAQLSAPIEATAVTLTLAAAESPYRLPPADGGVLVLADSLGKPTFVEIIRYASRDGQTLLGLERGIEGTTAFAWNTGDYCYQSITAGEFRRSSLWANQSADFTADAGSRNNLTASITASLPVNPAAGDTVEFIKLASVTPLIQTTDGALLLFNGLSDTSMIFNLNARLLIVWNGTAWEVLL